MLTVVGGVYRERCMRPVWDEIYGSAGRAASAIARLGGEVTLQTCLDAWTSEVLQARKAIECFDVVGVSVDRHVEFRYVHGLGRPGFPRVPADQMLRVEAQHVLRYGMIEGSAIVNADFAVFDPQNVDGPESFRANGSSAKHLALVLNRYEAVALLGEDDVDTGALAERLARHEQAEVVVIKMGPEGALVWANGVARQVSAYATPRVWKIGSGDQFAANFAYGWMVAKRSPEDAAERASRATAYYCEHKGFPTTAELDAYHPEPIQPSERWIRGHRPKVYLAGPFFTLGQAWVVEQARNHLRDMGLQVFSPYHDVGPGPADAVVPQDLDGIRDCEVMLAIADGLDAGTLYEVGYARRHGLPVVVYVENESAEDCKMMVGSDCFMRDDFVSAIYQTAWVAAEL